MALDDAVLVANSCCSPAHKVACVYDTRIYWGDFRRSARVKADFWQIVIFFWFRFFEGSHQLEGAGALFWRRRDPHESLLDWCHCVRGGCECSALLGRRAPLRMERWNCCCSSGRQRFRELGIFLMKFVSKQDELTVSIGQTFEKNAAAAAFDTCSFFCGQIDSVHSDQFCEGTRA